MDPAKNSTVQSDEARRQPQGEASSAGLAGRIAESTRRQELRDPDEGLGRIRPRRQPGRGDRRHRRPRHHRRDRVRQRGRALRVQLEHHLGRGAGAAAGPVARHDRGLSLGAPRHDDPHRLLLREAAARPAPPARSARAPVLRLRADVHGGNLGPVRLPFRIGTGRCISRFRAATRRRRWWSAASRRRLPSSWRWCASIAARGARCRAMNASVRRHEVEPPPPPAARRGGPRDARPNRTAAGAAP